MCATQHFVKSEIMIAKIFFVTIFAVVSSQEVSYKAYGDVDILKRLTDDGKIAVMETAANINNAPNDFDNYIEDRLCSLKWDGVVQKQHLNASITEAIFKGMLKNKQFSNFQCISQRAQETENKLNDIINQISVTSEKLKGKGLSGIMPFTALMSGFNDYVQDLFLTKSGELSKAGTEDARKKIMEEVAKKIKLLKSLLDQIKGQVKDALFKFFEEYISFAFATETNLRKTQRDGSNNILKCVS